MVGRVPIVTLPVNVFKEKNTTSTVRDHTSDSTGNGLETHRVETRNINRRLL
jgi:hypothetical protein